MEFLSDHRIMGHWPFGRHTERHGRTSVDFSCASICSCYKMIEVFDLSLSDIFNHNLFWIWADFLYGIFDRWVYHSGHVCWFNWDVFLHKDSPPNLTSHLSKKKFEIWNKSEKFSKSFCRIINDFPLNSKNIHIFFLVL